MQAVFLEWVRKTYDVNSFYSATPALLEHIGSRWEEWEDALLAWGILEPCMTPEEFRERLDSLSWEEIVHLGETFAEVEGSMEGIG